MNRTLAPKPVVTEKSMHLASLGQFTLFVPRGSEKLAIARAIETVYKVNVVSVNIARRYPKLKKRGKTSGYTSQLTKAIVRLKSGEKIPGFEVVAPAAEEKAEKVTTKVTTKQENK